MVVEMISIRPKLIPSTRFLLALLVSLGFVVQYAQRTNLSIAIVCMINKTELLIANNSRIIQRSSLFFKERQFLWNEWDQQIILGSYWGGYLLTLIPSKYFIAEQKRKDLSFVIRWLVIDYIGRKIVVCNLAIYKFFSNTRPLEYLFPRKYFFSTCC